MKSFLQNITLLTAVVLIASCGGGSSPIVDVVPVLPDPPPPSGVNGQVIKGPVVGATISVSDASGASVGLTETVTTGEDGSYSASFTVPAIEAGITTPITITATGGDITCDWDVDGDDDCGVGISFGSTYPAPAGFALSGFSTVTAGDDEETVVVNINVATDLAVQLAGAGADNDAVAAAEAQVLGLIQVATGANLSGVNLRMLVLPNLTAATSAALSEQDFAIALFGAAIIGQVGSNGLADIPAVIASIYQGITIVDGNISISGTLLTRMATQVSVGAAAIQAQLATAGVTAPAFIANIEANSAGNAALFLLAGDQPVTVSAPPVPGSDDPLDLTKTFVTSLSGVINSLLTTTGAQGFGGTQQGATEVFADELNAVSMLGSGASTSAFSQLRNAIDDVLDSESALTAGGSEMLSGDDVSGTLTLSDDEATTTLTDASSSWTDGDITVVLTIPSGTHMNDGASGWLSGTGITLTTSQGQTLLQTFTGDFSTTFSPENDDLGLNAMTFNGLITTSGAPGTFSLDVDLSELTGSTVASAGGSDIAGNYTVTLTFDDLAVSLNGVLRGLNQAFSITSGGNTILGTVTRDGDIDTDTLTDTTTTLTLVLDLSGSGELVSGTFTVGAEQTATLDSDGVVYYSDGSVQALPAAIF
ncbi:MAG: hypothetical protein P8J55_05310 [Pseudomonadales bacterium]|nr:hypothetical protein [Pseudomonadales bacterium]